MSTSRPPARRPERVALIDAPGVQSPFEPLHPLGSGAVGPALRHDVPLRTALNHVVPDRRRGPQPFLDVARLQDLPLLVGVMRPHPGQAVGLELHQDRQGVRLLRARPPPHAMDLLRDPQQVLDVMAHLVGDDVRLREVPRRSEALVELPEEREVDVDLAVLRTVEGPHRRLTHAARRRRRLAEQHEPRRRVASARVREDPPPGVLRVREDHRDELALGIGARLGGPSGRSGPARRWRSRGLWRGRLDAPPPPRAPISSRGLMPVRSAIPRITRRPTPPMLPARAAGAIPRRSSTLSLRRPVCHLIVDLQPVAVPAPC